MDVTQLLTRLYSDEGRQDPYPCYAGLHELGPVSPVPARAEHRTVAAVAVGYDLVSQVLRDPEWYKQAPPGWREQEVLRTLQTSMMFVNPPDHTRMRAVFAKTFTPRRLGALEPVVVRVVDELLDRMADAGAAGFDFVAEFAYPMPARVMAEFIGIPAGELDFYRQRVERIDDFLDVAGKTPQRLAAANAAAAELRAFYAGLIAHRRRRPGGDLISALVEAVDAGDVPLTEDELVSNLIVLFNAAFVTTVYMLSNGLPLLLSHPEVAAALPGDDALTRGAVDEILRLEAPVHFLARAAPRDTVLGGVPVERDQNVLLVIAAANRDPARFADPDRFDPRRPGPPSLAFGVGLHFCLGAAVSRLEGRLALPRLLRRFPRLAVAERPIYSGSLFLRGIDKLLLHTGGREAA
ncbi:cytochrome P450 [Micromonospora sp. C28SCA-DRY-2]|uniref:cytochrome P450 n=1 Tax=Micromonospora sp. C28SCA-DRY-2 TaxID=3059522 RepID=UPI002674ADE1|nr:cytochrome P450 [Micromonospora sp. C28SCA-DRY-2]MDO3705294.1 cytochrome P450 [Micromonospora sp. C28SCA-DRY-2]